MADKINGSVADNNWDSVITPHNSLFKIDFAEILRFRDLMMMFVKRDIVTNYKQTVLGPIWFVVQPILTTLMFTVVFGNIAKVSTNGIPKILFYLSSITLWNYFSETLTTTSKTFTDNAQIFGKVYFPRLVLPLSKVISGLAKFGIQFGLFVVIWVYFLVAKDVIHPNRYILLFPLLLLILVLLSMGLGIIITSLTTKYRDLTFLITFGIQLLMYATPVIYSVSILSPKKQFWLWLNPLTPIFEIFKYGFLGSGVVDLGWLMYSIAFTLVTLAVGVIIFNKVEKKFIDTV